MLLKKDSMHTFDRQDDYEHNEPTYPSSAGMPTQRLPPLPPDVVAQLGAPAEGDAYGAPLRVAFKTFSSSWRDWDTLFTDAAAFATRIGQERLISISHSADAGSGVVTVWFWADWREG
jgi:hypothetical protein